MASKIFLFWASGSAPSWRIQLTLEEKGITGYPNKLVSFDKKEHKAEDVLKWNPRGQVPTFVYDNVAINESMAACDYLEKVFGSQGKKLLPEDPVHLANVLQRKYEFLNLEKKGQEYIYYIWRTKPENVDQEEVKKRLNEFYEELNIWEKYVDQHGDGAHLASKDLSMADIIFFPTLAFYVRMGLDLGKKYPHLAKYYEMMCKKPSVQNTWPPHWKGTEAPNKAFK